MRSETARRREVLPRPYAWTWLGVALPATVAALLALGGEAARQSLRYERALLVDLSEPWRLITAHLVHMNPSHLLLDGAGLLLVGALLAQRVPLRLWALAFLLSCLTIDGGLFLWQPQLAWYVGLSGVLHGLFAAGAIWLLLARDPQAIWLLGALAAKLAWENMIGPMPWSTTASRGPVVEIAHSYGAAGGALALVALLVCSRKSRCLLRVQATREYPRPFI